MFALEYKLKRAALCAAVDITLRGREKSPRRCVRNLLELGETVCKDTRSREERNKVYETLLESCRTKPLTDCRALFFELFFPNLL